MPLRHAQPVRLEFVTEMLRCALAVNGAVEYATEVGTRDRAAVHADADEATRGP